MLEWKQRLLIIQLSHTSICMDISTRKCKDWAVYIKGKSEWRISPCINVSSKSWISSWIYLLFSWINNAFPGLHCLPSTCIKDFCFFFHSFSWLIVIFSVTACFLRIFVSQSTLTYTRTFKRFLLSGRFEDIHYFVLFCFIL